MSKHVKKIYVRSDESLYLGLIGSINSSSSGVMNQSNSVCGRYDILIEIILFILVFFVLVRNIQLILDRMWNL